MLNENIVENRFKKFSFDFIFVKYFPDGFIIFEMLV